MINRKTYLRIVFGVLGIVISYLLFFFISSFISLSRLATIDGKSIFDISTVLHISKDRITTESETYNKKEFIEYDCVLDNAYCINIVKVGKLTNRKLKNSLYLNKQAFPSRKGWFNNDFISPAPHPYFLAGFKLPYWAYYNVFLLPLKEVDKINVFVADKIISQEYINDSTVSYFIESYSTTFSFNDINKCDLEFLYANVINPIPANIFFTIDADRNLYIGCASTIKGSAKTLSEILESPKSNFTK